MARLPLILVVAFGCGIDVRAQCSSNSDCVASRCDTSQSPSICVADSGLCDRLATIDIAARIGSCNLPRGTNSIAVSTCEAGMPACDGGDRTALGQLETCLEELPTCQPGGETRWSSAETACFGIAGKMSSSCVNAILGP
jgi:hypothetical protein